MTDAQTPEDAPSGSAPKYPRVRLETTEGEITFELYKDVAPRHVDNFQQLIHQGFYDGLSFHRVVPGFIIQGGCPMGDGTGTPGWSIKAELNDRPHERGTLSMARRPNDPDTAGSQFFICLSRENCQHLDGEYTVFGRVVEGIEAVERIAETPLAHPELGLPSDPPHIIHAYELFGDEDEYHEPEQFMEGPRGEDPPEDEERD